MAWGFILIGGLFAIASLRGTHDDLWKLLKDDFTGEGNFIYWVMAIVFLVALGSFRTIRPVTDAFLGLVILIIVIVPYRDGKDLFGEFLSQVKKGTS